MGVAHASAGSRGLGVATGTGAAKQDQRRGNTLRKVELLAHEPTQGRGPAECVRHRFLEAYILAQVLLAEGNLSFVLTTAPIV